MINWVFWVSPWLDANSYARFVKKNVIKFQLLIININVKMDISYEVFYKYYLAMGGILVNNMPSLFSCEDLEDDFEVFDL
jgi:hypothetical protein